MIGLLILSIIIILTVILIGFFDAMMDARKDYPQNTIFKKDDIYWGLGMTWNHSWLWSADFWHRAKLYLIYSWVTLCIEFLVLGLLLKPLDLSSMQLISLCTFLFLFKIYLEGVSFGIFYLYFFRKEKRYSLITVLKHSFFFQTLKAKG